jgi:DNA modification methylase
MKTDIVHNKSCQDMEEVDENSVGLVITSPPYFSAKDYGYDLDYSFDLDSYDKYLEFLKEVFTECHRTLKKGRFIIINTSNIIVMTSKQRIDNIRLPIVPDTQRVLQEIGFEFIDDIVWKKPESACINRQANFFQTRRPLSYRPNQVTEYLLVYRKKGGGNNYFKDVDERTLTLSDIWWDDYESHNVWDIRPETNSKHPAPFPVELPKKCIDYYSLYGEPVLDPFMGSGTTALASKMSGRDYIGYELNKKFINMYKEKMSDYLTKESLLGVSEDEKYSTNLERIKARKSEAQLKTDKKKYKKDIEHFGNEDMFGEMK